MISKDISGEEIIRTRPVPHQGIDLIANQGDAVFAVEDGEIIEISFENELGNYILVKHNVDDVAYTKYGHLSKINVEVGDMVKKDEKIGEAGKTGMATGVCVHFEVLDENMNAIAPSKYIK